MSSYCISETFFQHEKCSINVHQNDWFKLKMLSLTLLVERQFGLTGPSWHLSSMQIKAFLISFKLEAFAFIPSLLWDSFEGSEKLRSLVSTTSMGTHMSSFRPEMLSVATALLPWIGASETQASGYPVQHRYHQSLLSEFPAPPELTPQASRNSSSLFLGWMGNTLVHRRCWMRSARRHDASAFNCIQLL